MYMYVYNSTKSDTEGSYTYNRVYMYVPGHTCTQTIMCIEHHKEKEKKRRCRPRTYTYTYTCTFTWIYMQQYSVYTCKAYIHVHVCTYM